jgi:hypothetical protein
VRAYFPAAEYFNLHYILARADPLNIRAHNL